MAQVFIPNTDNLPQVNHINGIKTDNRLENLEWVTAKYNMRHARTIGLNKVHGENCNFTKLKEAQVMNIRELFDSRQYTNEKISEMCKTSESNVAYIGNRVTWKHL